MDATVKEIHAYPLRPEGYAEPLFHDRQSRREILEHFSRSPWLWRASEAPRQAHQATESAREAQEGGAGKEGRVIASWREVDRWWEPDGGVDLVWRLLETPGGTEGTEHAVATLASAG